MSSLSLSDFCVFVRLTNFAEKTPTLLNIFLFILVSNINARWLLKEALSFTLIDFFWLGFDLNAVSVSDSFNNWIPSQLNP
jgi:hypothetical protein